MKACLGKRLNPAIPNKTINNSNTQKVDSFNGTLRRSLPRNLTFTKNFSGRAHSAAHSSNHGPGNSIHGLCSGVSAAVLTGGSVAIDKALDKMHKAHVMIKCITDQCLTEHRGLINAEN